jgi:hypothetical protein
MEKDTESGRSGRISHFERVLHQGVLNDDIINHPYKGSGSEDDPYLVTWIDNDPVNPMNYSLGLKWSITMLVAIATLAVAFVSSAYSGGIAEILQEFRVVQIIGTLGISLFVLGFAIGPLIWAPLSGESPLSQPPNQKYGFLTSKQNCMVASICSSERTCFSPSSTPVQLARRTSRHSSS